MSATESGLPRAGYRNLKVLRVLAAISESEPVARKEWASACKGSGTSESMLDRCKEALHTAGWIEGLPVDAKRKKSRRITPAGRDALASA